MERNIHADVIVFDLDNTLARSKTIIDEEMGGLLAELLTKKKVAVVSGGSMAQFKKELLDPLPPPYDNLHLFPTDGTAYFKWDTATHAWKPVYQKLFSEDEKAKILAAFAEVLPAAGFSATGAIGKIIEDRGSQITFSGLGQDAPLERKQVWDADKQIRVKIVELLAPKLPDYELMIAGTTSIDVTAKGLDKAYAIHKISEELNVDVPKMVFIGDAIFEGGNDYPVVSTGVPYIKVTDPEDTKQVIREIINI